MMGRAWELKASVLAVLLVTPALAQTSAAIPGNPCATGNGNPCNDNEGNDGKQGNSGGKEKVRHDKPVPITINVPAISGRTAFISQIGDDNRAGITQTAPTAYASIRQHGDRNVADVTQSGSGLAYTELRQIGAANRGTIIQDGTGQNVLFAAQAGERNAMVARQTANEVSQNGAIMGQAGSDNSMSLTQDGGDNRAVLGQVGDGNKMTATQEGEGNRLVWTQVGNNLSDLGIKQNGTGATAMVITQTRQ